jgi:hypothetical protein
MAHITYDRNKPAGKLTAELVDFTINARELADRVKVIADQITGGGVTPVNLETGNAEGAANFGVPVGQGANFYTALTNVRAGLNAIAGGAAGLGDLDLGG